MDYIKKTVKKYIKKYKTNNPSELADCLGIKVMYEPLGKNIRGFYQGCPKNKVIHINEVLTYKEKLVVLAHELGHALLHSNLHILFLEKNTFLLTNKYEMEANKFAAELLIDDDLINDSPDYYTLQQIASLHELPIELFKLKYEVE